MRALQRQHIVDLFVLVDDSLPKQVKPGAKSVLTDSELLTILVWDGITEPRKNLSSIYAWIEREYSDYFPRLPAYQNFVAHCHRLLPQLVWFLQSLLAVDASVGWRQPLWRQRHAKKTLEATQNCGYCSAAPHAAQEDCSAVADAAVHAAKD